MPSTSDGPAPNGDRGAQQPSGPTGEPRRLTLGQRILTTLPSLSKPDPAPRRPADQGRGDRTPRPDPGGRPEAVGETDAPPPEAPPATQATTDPRGRLRDAFLKPAAETPSKPIDRYKQMSSAELRHSIKYLDDRERLYGLLAAPIGLALAISGLVYDLVKASEPLARGAHRVPATTYYLVAGFGMVFALSLLASAWYRRRSFALASLLFVGFSASNFDILFLLPFWGLAAVWFLRSTRMQKVLTLRGETPRSTRPPRPGQARAPGPGGRQPAGPGRANPRAKAPSGGPTQSKRYTPPKPTRPKIAKPPTS